MSQKTILVLSRFYEKEARFDKALYGYNLALKNDPGNGFFLSKIRELESKTKKPLP